MLRHTQAGDIGAPSAENADFIVIQTHLSFGFWSDAKQSSASRRYGCRWWPQFRDQPQDVGKQISRDGDLGHLECGRRSKSSLRTAPIDSPVGLAMIEASAPK
jgi:hypothetical protein